MDNLQPPEELQHLWLDRPPEREDLAVTVTRVLRDARKFQRRAHALDIVMIVLYVLLLPLGLLVVVLLFRDDLPLLAASYLVWTAVLVAGLGGLAQFPPVARRGASPRRQLARIY